MDAAGALPGETRALFDRALVYHCSVCLSELATGLANADPSRRSWVTIRDHYCRMFDAIPTGRILNPDPQIWAEAGVVTGLLARTQGYHKHRLRQCLNDVLIYLTATRAGLPVLTANRDDFDLIQQLVPEGQFIHF
jgi:predicted nucleic acid-binding protein